MSATSLRFHQLTLSFMPGRRERYAHAFARRVRVRLGRRRVKKFVRNLYA